MKLYFKQVYLVVQGMMRACEFWDTILYKLVQKLSDLMIRARDRESLEESVLKMTV